MIIIPIKWLFHWERNIPYFQTNPYVSPKNVDIKETPSAAPTAVPRQATEVDTKRLKLQDNCSKQPDTTVQYSHYSRWKSSEIAAMNTNTNKSQPNVSLSIKLHRTTRVQPVRSFRSGPEHRDSKRFCDVACCPKMQRSQKGSINAILWFCHIKLPFIADSSLCRIPLSAAAVCDLVLACTVHHSS